MKSRLQVLAPLFILALCTSVQGARGTTVLPIDLDALVDQAQLIFTGRAVHREVVLSQDGRFPFTFVTFRVDETLKGRVRNREMILRFHGGEIGDEVVVVEGVPEFELGERYLLFVADNGNSSFPVVGWRQGQYRFDREPRSGDSVLVDDQGHALESIERGHWRRRALSVADGPAAPGAVLLGEEGIDVAELPVDQAKDQSDRIPKAQEVLAALRQHVRSRSRRPTFAPGRFVESARPQDVPAHVEWRSVPPPR